MYYSTDAVFANTKHTFLQQSFCLETISGDFAMVCVMEGDVAL